MKTKLLSAVLGLGLVFTVGACANNKKEEKKGYDETVLSGDKDGFTFHMVGGFEGKWAGYEENKMTATSVAKVAEKDKALADTLKGKNLTYLYMMEGVHLGEGVFDMKDWTQQKEAAGYTKRFKAADGKIYLADGSYTIKALRCTYDAEDQNYINSQWISDPKTGHTEALTSNLFYPTWQEKKDADGFAWNQDPVCTGGSGTYTVVVAQYKEVSAPDVFGFGVGLIKTNSTEKNAYTVEEKLVVNQVSLIGAGVGSWEDDVDLTKGTDGKWKINDVAISTGEWKVRVNHAWNVDFDASCLDEASQALVANTKMEGNIVLKEAGHYAVTVDVVVMGGVADGVIHLDVVH